MSAILLCCVILLAPYASSAVIGRDDGVEGFQIIRNGKPQPHILVEEVKNGNSIIRDLELPALDDSEELREDKERREEQEREFREDAIIRNRQWREKYGCELQDERLKRKCLLQQKQLLKRTFQDLKRNIQRLIKDIDTKLTAMGDVVSEESLSDDLDLTSGHSLSDGFRDSLISSEEPTVYQER